MAVKASNVLPEQAYRDARVYATLLKAYLQSRSEQFQAGPTNADVLLATFHDVRRIRDSIQAAAGVPGIANYARAQENDPAYDVIAEWTALLSAVASLLSFVTTNFPKDANGYLLEKTFAADGTYVFRTFTSAQLAGLVSAIAAVVALIA